MAGYWPAMVAMGAENWGSVPERERAYWLPFLRKAAGAEITQCRGCEVVTIRTSAGLCSATGMSARQTGQREPIGGQVWCQQPGPSIRARTGKGAAVIPAPIAYTNVVAVRKLVVGGGWLRGLPRGGHQSYHYCLERGVSLHWGISH